MRINTKTPYDFFFFYILVEHTHIIKFTLFNILLSYMYGHLCLGFYFEDRIGNTQSPHANLKSNYLYHLSLLIFTKYIS